MIDEVFNRFNGRIVGVKDIEGLTANSSLLNTAIYYPEYIILKHVPVEEKDEKPEVTQFEIWIFY